MWPTLRQLWKEWYIFIIALCLLIIPVLLFAPQENTRFQSASNNVQSNKVENSANVPAAQNLPQSSPASSQKSSQPPSTQATAPRRAKKPRNRLLVRRPLTNHLSPPQPRPLLPRQLKKLRNKKVLLHRPSRQR